MKRLAVVVFTIALSGCVSASVRPLKAPPTVKQAPTSTSVPDYSGTSLPPVGGTTTTAPVSIRGGRASLQGRVVSGGGPVGGSTVHIERFEDDQSASIDVITNADGAWRIDGLLGGRYRVRAYHPPDSAMTVGQVLYLGATENRSVDLSLSSFTGGLSIRYAIAPDPPVLGEMSNLVISVTTRGVDAGGVARAIPAPNVAVLLIPTGGWVIVSSNPTLTDGSGRAVWSLRCDSLDHQDMTAVLPDGSQPQINVSRCSLPATTTSLPVSSSVP